MSNYEREELPSVAETYQRITGQDPIAIGKRVAADTIGVPCVSPLNHQHGDSSPSLHISTRKDAWICRVCTGLKGQNVGGKSIAMVIHAGLANNDAEAIKWLLPEGQERPKSQKHRVSENSSLVAQYEYQDKDGKTLFQVQRYEDSAKKKTFKQRHPDPTTPGGWAWNLDGVTRVPYRLRAVLEAISKNETICVFEGEKCAEAAAQVGIEATTNAGGSSWVWDEEFVAWFRGADRIIVVGDNDDVGRAAARRNAEMLLTVCPNVFVIEALPGVKAKGDIYDWLKTGKTKQDWWNLVDQMAKRGGPEIDDGTLHVWSLRDLDKIIGSEPPPKKGVPFGITRLDDELFGMQGGQITTLGARTNVGKSAMAERIIMSAVLKQYKVIACSLEMGARGFYNRVLSRALEMQVKEFRLKRHEITLNPGLFQSTDNMLHIIGATRHLTVAALEEKIDEIRPDLLVIDHSRHIQGWMSNKAAGRSDLAPADILYQLDEIMPKYGAHMLMLSQCTRDAHASRPELSELRDSGAVEEVSDNVIFLHRPYMYEQDEKDDVCEVLLWKSRESSRFIAHMDWVGPTMEFVEPTRAEDILRTQRCCAKMDDDGGKHRRRDD